MTIELTEEQQQVLTASGDKLQRIVDPKTHSEYVLVPAQFSKEILEIMEDELQQRAIRKAALKNIAAKLALDE